MSYDYRYINKNFQFGETSFTLILESTDNESLPTIRIEKNFRIDEKLIDSEFLYQEAIKEIRTTLIHIEQTQQQVIIEVE